MNNKNTLTPISDELLNSFIDHQITREERQEILARIKQDKDLARRVCDLQHTKEMSKLAYQHIPASRLPEKIVLQNRTLPRLAAIITIFSLGLLLGLTVTQVGQRSQNESFIQSENTVTKVLVHLTSAETESALNTLNNLHLLLQEYQHKQEAVEVEVIANGKGIQLLDAGNVAVSQRIKDLTDQYRNLTIAACRYSIEQYRLTRGMSIDLIPQARVIDSGVVEVIKRQNEGWTYIRG